MAAILRLATELDVLSSLAWTTKSGKNARKLQKDIGNCL
jgi:hypothetical protein